MFKLNIYNQVVASAPPKNRIQVSIFVAILGGVWALVSFVFDSPRLMTGYGFHVILLGILICVFG